MGRSARPLAATSRVNGLPWSMLKISRLPQHAKASFEATMRNSTARMFDIRQDSTFRVDPFTTATRCRKLRRIGLKVMPAHQARLPPIPAMGEDQQGRLGPHRKQITATRPYYACFQCGLWIPFFPLLALARP